ncbi:DUF5801 repeats-in-toxin domain-containing protein [Sphingomonas sp.]|uniref:beta strand repeat-containing protein n=1 Tax=Sphingomonas sp. TaxID=28214 RepID=UPI0017B36D44|nr:DUF5801 repeats-in-toxin domain-containing protein [Sphingomonas sp.]MBA3511969.1 hypothetical protein [Sphingomonas sp.]
MRYEDASGSFSSQGAGAPDARDDADALAAGSRGPATGNTITGEGTITGAVGADVVNNGPGKIVGLEGAGGSDTGEGGSLHVQGRFGEITMDSRGGYSYTPHAAKPEGGSDVFRYTLADADGTRDTATLRIDIGREIEKIEANAQQIVPGPDGVVTLPEGVQLSDILVVGRNLVINLPDGTQMVIIDGAVFVPQLVLGGVEVPASNLAALLIDAEPQPAAGTPLSSGGNFAIIVPPLDPGVPLGDLIPPTQLGYTPPIFEDIGQFNDEEPTIIIETPDNPAGAINAIATVHEAGLPVRGTEPPGSNSAATSEFTSGVIVFEARDGVRSLTINGVEVVVGAVINGAHGTMTITSVAPGEIGFNYLLLDNTSGDATTDNFSMVVTDRDGDQASATLTVNIIDDVPMARNDTDAVLQGQSTTTGNVMTGIGTTNSPAGIDTVGADDARVSAVSGAGGSDSSFDEAGNLVVTGSLGTLTINAAGGYTYVANPDSPGGSDVFTYTLRDGDGDQSNATLTITVPADLRPTLDLPAAGQAGTVVDEAGLPPRGGEPAGSGEAADGLPHNGSDDSETTSGTIRFTPGDAPAVVRIDGIIVTGTVGQTFLGDHGVLTITGYNAATGTITYSYTLTDNTSGDNTEDSFAVSVTDADGDVASGNLVIDIIDDVPTARPDTDTIAAGQYGPATGNVITDAAPGDAGDADNGADTVGADNAVVTSVDNTANATPAQAVPAGGFVSVAGQYGTLTIFANGDYSYTRNEGTPGGVTETFSYTITDGDGDPSTSTLTITIEDRTVVIGQNAVVRTDDDAVPGEGGNPGGPEDDVDAANLTGTLSGSGGDGPLAFDLLTTGAPPGFTYVDGPNGSILVQQVQHGSTVTVLTITVDAATGAYTVTQNAAILHPTLNGQPGDDTENNVAFTINYTVRDVDGDTAAGTLVIDVDDDTPQVVAEARLTGVVDEDGLGDGNPGGVNDAPGANVVASGNVAALFSPGADQPVTYSLLTNTSGLPTLTSNGVAVTYSVSGNTLTASAGGNVVFTFTVNATTGDYTFTLRDQLDHPSLDGMTGDNTENPEGTDIEIALGSIIRATDADGDSVTAPAGGLVITVDDDSPEEFAECPDDTIAVNNPGSTFTGDLNLPSVGADGPGTVSFVVENGTPVTDSDGNPVSSNGQPLYYTINAGNPSILEARTDADPGEGELIFTLTLNSNGTYTYNQVGEITSVTEISIANLSSVGGGNVEARGINVPDSPYDLILTTQPGNTVNTNATEMGVGTGQSFQAGEILRIDLVQNVFVSGTGGSEVLNFGEYYTANSYRQDVSGLGGPQRADFIVRAIVVNEAPGSDPSAPADGDNVFFGDTNDTVVAVTSLNIYNAAGTLVAPSAYAGLGITVTPAIGGGWQITGLPNDYDFEIVSSTAFNAVQVEATAGTDTFKLGFIDITSTVESSVNLSVDIALTDADGDSVVCDIDVILGPPSNTPSVTVLVNEAALNDVGSNPGSTDETQSGGLADHVTGGTPPYTFELVGSGDGTYGTLTLNSDGTYTYTLDTPFDSQPDANDGTNVRSGAESFTYRATDDNGVVSTGTITINIVDDVPSIDVTAGSDASVVVETQDADTIGNASDTASSTANFSGAFGLTFVAGADGAAATPVLGYTLGVSTPGVDSGLDQGGANIYLHLIGGKVVGSTSSTLDGVTLANTVFDVSVSSSGAVTLTQYSQIDHPVGGDPTATAAPFADHFVSMADGLVTLTASSTITDNDGDRATDSETLNIGGNLRFADDGPTINVTQTGEGNVVLTTQDAQTIGGASDADVSTAGFGGVFGVASSGGADGTASVNTAYSLTVTNSISGLTSQGAAINLYNVGGTIVGSTSGTLAGVNAGNTIFTVGVSATGVVTLTQHQQVDHAVEGTTTAPFDDQFTVLANGKITLTATSTITDNDGDTAADSEVVDLGGNIRFADDGPDISVTLAGTQIRIDETDGVVAAGGEVDPLGGNLGTVTVPAATLFTVNNLHTSADAPTTYSYALTLSSQGVNSGLLLSTTNAPIFLYNIDGTVVGSTSATEAGVNTGNTAFTASINASTGAVTLTQFFAVEHGNTASLDEDSSALAAGVLNVTVTATDFDGDTDTASADLGSVIRFEDDGPSIDVTGGADAGVILQTQDADTLGTATDTASSSANFGGVFGLTFNGGSDGAASTPALSYTLGVSAPGVNSGLDQGGADIFLYLIGGKVVGSTSNTSGGVNVGNTVFDVSVSATGVVTLTQYSQIDHPIGGDPTPSATPFADHIISMTDSLVTLTASSSITDNDGDTVNDSATISIGSNLQFADHGPVATNDVDSIVGGNGPATGNVITGVDFVGGDANGADGNADSVGADTPGTITRVQSVNVSANVDTTYDSSGNLVLNGQYGTLTINANGNYSYLRTDGSAGGVSDVFTYTLTDRDGDTATATLTIGIADSFPTAGNVNVQLDDDALIGGNAGGPDDDDPNSVNASGTLPGSGGDGTLTFSVQTTGAPTSFTYESGGAGVVLVKQGGTTVLTVTVNANGTYSVVQNAPIMHAALNGTAGDNSENNVQLTINYTVTDADGDPASGTISIDIDDDTPTISAASTNQPTLTVDETDLTIDDTKSFASVFTTSFGADGAAAANATVYTLGVNAGASGIVDTGTNEAVVLTVNGSGQVEGRTATSNLLVFVLSVDGSGNVTLDQQRAVVHNDPSDHDEPGASAVTLAADNLITLTRTITDSDGDSASATANIGQNLQFEDDGPSAAVATTGFSISHDETPGVQTDANDVADPLTVFTTVTNPGEDPHVAGTGPIGYAVGAGAIGASGSAYGADGAGTTAFSLDVSSAGVDSGLDTTEGLDIFLFKEGDLIVGRVGNASGPAAFALAIDAATGQVSMVQYLSIKHPSTASPDESVTIASGALLAVTTVTDRDGDVSTASTGIGNLVSFQDDGPTLGTVQNQQTDNNPATDPAVGTLHFTPGADGPGSTMTITANVTGLTSGGFNLVTVQSGNVLTAYQDVGPAGYDTGDTTAVFTITVDPSAGTSGQYVFDLITPLDPTVSNTPIGGASSFGAGPTGYQVLTSATGQELTVVSGFNAGVGFSLAAWQSGAPATGLTTAGVNGSTAGWGVANNNFDSGEFFNWDFGNQPFDDPDGPTGSFAPPNYGPDDPAPPNPDVQLPDISFATFDFIGYAAADDIYYVVRFTDGSFASGQIPDANLGSGPDWTYTAPAGKFIADIEMYSPNAAPGKVDLVSVGVQQTSINVTIPATVTLTDGDGDPTGVGNFTIQVQSGATPSTPAAAATLMVSKEYLGDTSSLSLMSSDSTDNQRTMSAANNNSVLLGAIAAAGLGTSSAAAANGFSVRGDDTMPSTMSFGSDGGSQGVLDDSADTARRALDGETQENVGGTDEHAGASSGQRAIVDKLSLTDGGGDQEQAPTPLLGATELQQSDPAQSTLTSAAVGMPAAEMLIPKPEELAVEGQGRGTAEVGRVLIDALAGGDSGPNIDTIIDAVANHGDGAGAAALQSLATYSAVGVSAWHTAGFAGFPGASASTIEPMLHQDAVQAA